MLYDIHSLQPNQKIEGQGHYSDYVNRKPYALFESGEDGVVIITVTFNAWKEKSIGVL